LIVSARLMVIEYFNGFIMTTLNFFCWTPYYR